VNAREREKVIDALYRLPLAEFTARRNELVKELKNSGDETGAGSVGKLRKPSLPAWAVNQLAHLEKKRIKELFSASDALRDAHAAGGAALRDATKARNSLISQLVDRAATILEEAGHSPGRTHLDKITATLQASADEEYRDELAGGRLVNDLQPTGFGGLAEWESLPTPKGTVTKLEPAEVRKARREAEDLLARAESAEERALALRESADRARRKAEEAEEAADAADRAAQAARKRAEDGTRRLDELARPVSEAGDWREH
jgi:hypothetical protein